MFGHTKKQDPDGPPPYAGDLKPTAGPSTMLGTVYACVHLARTDRVRILGFPQSVRSPLGVTIKNAWPVGIQKEEVMGNGYEWKLVGNPWSGQGREAVPSRRLITHILTTLANIGYHLIIAADLSKKMYDKDTLFFRSGPSIQRRFFAMSFNESDKIRLIDSPDRETLDAFIGVVQSYWPLGIQDSKEKEESCWQIKLRGTPWWTSNGNQVDAVRLLACSLLAMFDSRGYEVVASVDLSVGNSEGSSES
ncbi:hypothetical protein M231_02560 [Tremella mesenterica]|uniref:Uncharacterized protein n=1 Tax=Tremella mesenterica TaxID=5217 RepID=A0A4Q1BQA9_TREME|nr:hypothetical protein M231_02560 [Tremella mesenterica]